MYIETSSSRQNGDNAKLQSPKLQFSGDMCLKFYYHMYGSDIKTLNVIINGDNVFTASGEKGNKWLKAAIDVNFSGEHVVREIIMPFGRCLVHCNCKYLVAVSVRAFLDSTRDLGQYAVTDIMSTASCLVYCSCNDLHLFKWYWTATGHGFFFIAERIRNP